MSTVPSSPRHHLTKSIASAYYGPSALQTIEVPVIIVDDCIMRSGYPRVGFIDLDVEGLEDQALKGLDLDKLQVRYLLVECNDEQAVMSALCPFYAVERGFGEQEIL